MKGTSAGILATKENKVLNFFQRCQNDALIVFTGVWPNNLTSLIDSKTRNQVSMTFKVFLSDVCHIAKAICDG